ncbi:unnamed protein product, partial [Allacma fusca]
VVADAAGVGATKLLRLKSEIMQ